MIFNRYSDADLSTSTKRITLDANLWQWVETESEQFGMPVNDFIATLLDWARDESIFNDQDLAKPRLDAAAGEQEPRGKSARRAILHPS